MKMIFVPTTSNTKEDSHSLAYQCFQPDYMRNLQQNFKNRLNLRYMLQ